MPIALVLLGAQGSGKGTISAEFAKRGFIPIIMGDILRNKKSNHPDFVAKYFSDSHDMDKGELQSDAAVFVCLVEALRRARNQNVVLDGCIRSVEQAQAVLKELKTRYYQIVVIYLDCEPATSLARIEKRRDEMIKNGQTPRPDDCSRDAIKQRLEISYTTISEIIATVEKRPISLSVYTVSVETHIDRVIDRIDNLLNRLAQYDVRFRVS